jgi:hypothetical protein
MITSQRGITMRFTKLLTAAALLTLVPAQANAAAVDWTLTGATFTDGGTATGSFTFDAGTGQVSAFFLSVSGGNTAVFAPFNWTNDTATYESLLLSGGFFNFRDNLTSRQLRIAPAGALTDAGGTIALDLSNLFAADCFNCDPFRAFASGSLVAAAAPAVPEPGTWALMLLGFGAVGLAFRRRPAPLPA